MQSQSMPPANESTLKKAAEVAALFLKLGFTAFGGPAAHIAMMRDEIVSRRKWVSNERFVDLMGIANLIPGPTSTELAIYLGYVRAGWIGLLLAGICFIGPAMLIVIGLAWAYVAYGALPQAGWLFYGIQPVVVAIIAQAVWQLGRAIIKGIWPLTLALLVLLLYLFGVNVLILLFGGALFFTFVSWTKRTPKLAGLAPFASLKWQSLTMIGSLAVAAIPFSQLLLFLTFLKIGSVLYGGGYVLIAFLRTDLVQRLHWLTDKQLLDAISVGQFTPGPLFTTATFIGYILAGLPGALVATLAIFLPSFAFVALIQPVAARLRQSSIAAPFLDGVNTAALALMAGVLIQLTQNALADSLTILLALASLGILLRFKINSAWMILLGTVIGYIHFMWRIF